MKIHLSAEMYRCTPTVVTRAAKNNATRSRQPALQNAPVCGEDPHAGCTSCGKRCHVNSSDARCPYFQRLRGQITWDANVSQLQDTQAGTGGSLPHQSQINWRFNGNTTSGSTSIVVDGRPYYVQYGNPGKLSEGERNNCLIDSLRQCIGVQCDRTLVRADLQSLYEFHAGRANNVLSERSQRDGASRAAESGKARGQTNNFWKSRVE